MPTISPLHHATRKNAWRVSAVAFALFILDMFVLQQGPFFTNVFLAVFGFTMIVDGSASVIEKKFSYFGISYPGLLAQIAGSVIVVVGFFMCLGGLTALIS